MGLLCWSLKLLWLGVMSVSMTAMTRLESGFDGDEDGGFGV